MKNLTVSILAIPVLFISSCTFFLVNEINGGHSPMMQLDGKWNIDKNTKTVQGTQEGNGHATSVWFNATKDVGGYCEGTWYFPDKVNDGFLWSIDKDGSEFTMTDENGVEVEWNVIEQQKKAFIIERTEGDSKYRIELSK